MFQKINLPLHWIVDLLFPLQCLNCGLEGIWICNKCTNKLPTIRSRHCPFCERKNYFGNTCNTCKPNHFIDGAISCIPYANPLVQSMINTWKYNYIKDITTPLSNFVEKSLYFAIEDLKSKTSSLLGTGVSKKNLLMLSTIPPLLTSETVLINPIPLHVRKLRERGFNQAHELARALSKHKKNRILIQCIERIKNTPAQAKLNITDRKNNTKEAFVLRQKYVRYIYNKHIVLIDDVITTGSTIDSAAKLLKNNGALSIWALTVAYGHPIRP
jgi:ComF family protein